MQSVRCSVWGMAAEVLLNLGVHVTIIDVIEQFDTVSGSFHPSEQLIEDLYVNQENQVENLVEQLHFISPLLTV